MFMNLGTLRLTSIFSDDPIQLFLNSVLRFRVTGSSQNHGCDGNRCLNNVSSTVGGDRMCGAYCLCSGTEQASSEVSHLIPRKAMIIGVF